MLFRTARIDEKGAIERAGIRRAPREKTANRRGQPFSQR